MPARVLILGGTGAARTLATILAARTALSVVVSLAGRTAAPAAQAAPIRSGGFGGVDGMTAYLIAKKIDAMIDATHPFAIQISAHAASAAARTGVPLIVLRRQPWTRRENDKWHVVATISEAAEALGEAPKRVFLAIGRKEIIAFQSAPQHAYVLRAVDAIEPMIGPPDVKPILARGPFSEAGERDLLCRERIDVIVCRNSGGAATIGKIDAARRLGLPVVMIERPPDPAEWADCDPVETIEAVVARLDQVFGAP